VAKVRGLGRGLSALLPDATPAAGEGPREVPVGALQPNPDQPRRRFDPDRLAELAASVREHGVLEPIVVRPAADGFEIVAGERRWRAAAMAGLERVPVVVREVGEDRMLEVALAENLQREDLGVWEAATAFRALMQRFGWTQEALAEHVSKSRSHVANTLRVLALPERARRLVEEGRLTLGQVKAVLEAPADAVETLAQQTADEDLTVRQIGERVAALGRARGPRRAAGGEARAWPALLDEAAGAVGARLGRPLRWRAAGRGGEISLAVSSTEEAARLLRAIERGLLFLEEHEPAMDAGASGDVPRGTFPGR